MSVSDVNTRPARRSSSRSSRWFSMMPLCTTVTPSEVCGCAFCSEGRPWVAQRVWPTPITPGHGSAASRAFSATSFPAARRTLVLPPSSVATPAES